MDGQIARPIGFDAVSALFAAVAVWAQREQICAIRMQSLHWEKGWLSGPSGYRIGVVPSAY